MMKKSGPFVSCWFAFRAYTQWANRNNAKQQLRKVIKFDIFLNNHHVRVVYRSFHADDGWMTVHDLGGISIPNFTIKIGKFCMLITFIHLSCVSLLREISSSTFFVFHDRQTDSRLVYSSNSSSTRKNKHIFAIRKTFITCSLSLIFRQGSCPFTNSTSI